MIMMLASGWILYTGASVHFDRTLQGSGWKLSCSLLYNRPLDMIHRVIDKIMGVAGWFPRVYMYIYNIN